MMVDTLRPALRASIGAERESRTRVHPLGTALGWQIECIVHYNIRNIFT